MAMYDVNEYSMTSESIMKSKSTSLCQKVSHRHQKVSHRRQKVSHRRQKVNRRRQKVCVILRTDTFGIG